MSEVRWAQAVPRLRIVVTSATTAGARPPVLMPHGLWHAAWAWENWSDRLTAHGYDCHAVDLRGHGGSEGDIRTARLRDYLQDARHAVAAMPETPILIGHSLGGVLVEHLLAADTYPAAVLVASVPGRYPLGTVVRTTVSRPVKTLEAALRRDLAPLVGTPRAARQPRHPARHRAAGTAQAHHSASAPHPRAQPERCSRWQGVA